MKSTLAPEILILLTFVVSSPLTPSLTLSGVEYNATSVHQNNNTMFGPKRAFQRAHYNSALDRSFPWISRHLLKVSPQTVSITLPSNVTVAQFSFRSRPENDALDWVTKFSPTNFEFIGSNNCDTSTESWETILPVTGVVWTGRDQEKSWVIPKEKRGSYKCYGFRVHESISKEQTAIQDAKLFEGTVPIH